MRVVSLLPAATEIVAALGRTADLVGVSHECDYPPEVALRPRVTHCEIHGGGLASEEADRWVANALATTGTLYTLDEPLVRRLAPDVVITQQLCDVCAVGYESVTAFAAALEKPPVVVSLSPSSIADVLEDVHRVARALGSEARGAEVVTRLRERIAAVRERATGLPRRPCVLLEWIAPPYRSGHWDPELVEMAGGTELLGRRGEDAARIPWEAVVEAAPDVIVLACCGYDVERTLADVPLLRERTGWSSIPAVQNDEVWVVDGSAYFSRPGPRIVDSLELLATLLHPDVFPATVPPHVAVRVR